MRDEGKEEGERPRVEVIRNRERRKDRAQG
jgi:hypothetical protein